MYCMYVSNFIYTHSTSYNRKFMQSDETHACQLMLMISIMPHDLEMFRNI